jgi:hypothetical protein
LGPTDCTIAPLWLSRAWISGAAGFDLSTAKGCAAARRFAVKRWDPVVDQMDAAIRGDFRTELNVPSEHFNDLWAAWCHNGNSRPMRRKLSAAQPASLEVLPI